MNVLSKLWNCTATGASHAWNLALDVGWSVWSEVSDGARRLSWWVLLGLVWLDGLAVGWWLWVR